MSDDLRMKFSKFMPQDLESSPAYERWAGDIKSDDPDQAFWLSDNLGRKMLSAVSLPTTPVAAIRAFGFLSMMGSLRALSSFD